MKYAGLAKDELIRYARVDATTPLEKALLELIDEQEDEDLAMELEERICSLEDDLRGMDEYKSAFEKIQNILNSL